MRRGILAGGDTWRRQSRKTPCTRSVAVNGVRSEGGLTEFILEKMIAEEMTIMSITSKKTIAKKMTITKFAAVSTRRPPSESPRILNNPRNRILKSTMSRIFHTARGVQCVSRLAWNAALEALGQPSPGDVDPVLRGIRRGTRRLQVPRVPRQRVCRRLLRRLLVCAIQKNDPGWSWWAFLGIIAHSIALRMPSELINCLLSSLSISCTRSMKGESTVRLSARCAWICNL